ncbi:MULTISPECIES: siderophore ABC transporter substrate-binding protein [unclassified Roseovarius]|uniref:siderophore ABC transporter substrate-binding protein n=1 Tax=unclassified Roseovarius TaxID=2614913 RepID=UPI0027400BE8|nr:siderophore ABC transporter substrate-binding protein [Roseovarius sp. MMSF_3350]
MLRIFAFALCLAAGPVAAQDVTVETYRGPVTVAQTPETVAVYDMAALDTLEALGVEVDGTISNVYLDYLEDVAEGAARIGTLFEPDMEALYALHPDLIIAGGRSHDKVPDLAKIAPTIDMTIHVETLATGLKRLEAYGAIFGRQDEAAALADKLTRKQAEVRKAAAGAGRTLIVMTNGPKVSAYGPVGRFGWLHTAFGLEVAAEEVKGSDHGEAISFEFIRQVDPDVILVIDRSAAIGDVETATSTLDNVLVRETKAWRNGQVITLDSAPIYIAAGGVQALNATMDQLLAAFSGN